MKRALALATLVIVMAITLPASARGHGGGGHGGGHGWGGHLSIGSHPFGAPWHGSPIFHGHGPTLFGPHYRPFYPWAAPWPLAWGPYFGTGSVFLYYGFPAVSPLFLYEPVCGLPGYPPCTVPDACLSTPQDLDAPVTCRPARAWR